MKDFEGEVERQFFNREESDRVDKFMQRMAELREINPEEFDKMFEEE